MMIKRLSTYYSSIRDGLSKGLIAGAVMVFLILIGLPSGISGREALAPLALPLFALIVIAFSVSMTRRFGKKASWARLISNGIALGIGLAIVFLLFMALINRWQSRNFPVQDYFAEVTPGTTARLSGVPLAELFPNPRINPLTQSYPSGARLRTNPMQLTVNDDHISVLNLGVIQVGGLFGTALMLAVLALLSVVVYRVLQQINWQAIRTRLHDTFILSDEGSTPVIVTIGYWLRLVLPFALFLIFWATISHSYDTAFWRAIFGDNRVNEMVQGRQTLLNLNRLFNLSLNARQNVQLILTFSTIISLLIAWRSIKARDHARLPYVFRAGIIFALLGIIFCLAVWRISTNNIEFIQVPLGIVGLSSVSSLPGVMLLIILRGASIAAAFALLLVLLIYTLSANQDASQFESTLVGATGIGLMLAMPLFMDQYQTAVLNLVAIYVMLGLGLNIVVGYAGLLDLGYVAFFAIGAYMYGFLESKSQYTTTQHISNGLANQTVFSLVTAILIVPVIVFTAAYFWKQFAASTPKSAPTTEARHIAPLWKDQPPFLLSLGLVIFSITVALIATRVFESIGVFSGIERASPFLLGIIIAVIASAFAGILLGFPVLRLRSDYLAIVTLGFGEIISISLENLLNITGGPFGAQGVPAPLPEGASIAEENLVILYLGIVGAGLVIFLSYRLRNSRIGRAWTALRSDEDITQAMGVNLVNSKLMAFAIGAAFAGISGVLFASRQSNLFPNQFSLVISINVLALVIIGGTGSVPGVIVGAIVLVGLPETLRAVQDYRIMSFGALLVVTMLIRPKGLLPAPLALLEERAQQLRQRIESSNQNDASPG